ncbi:MAG: hypothetical protein V7607_3352 [Solirubrobacteraceae bacterium]
MGQTLVRRCASRSRSRQFAVGLAMSVAVLAGTLPGQRAARAADPPIAASITGDQAARGKPISDRLFGIFFEDINHAADGGLYPELVQNRSFEFSAVDNPTYNGLTSWSLAGRGGAAGSVAVVGDQPLNGDNLN